VQAEQAVVQPRMWRKKMAAARVKREFRTAEEVLQEAAEKPAVAPRQAILDMRGPQERHLPFNCTSSPCPHASALLASFFLILESCTRCAQQVLCLLWQCTTLAHTGRKAH
jgi:hypothetical protein